MSTRFFCFCFSAIQRKNASNALNLNFRKKRVSFTTASFFLHICLSSPFHRHICLAIFNTLHWSCCCYCCCCWYCCWCYQCSKQNVYISDTVFLLYIWCGANESVLSFFCCRCCCRRWLYIDYMHKHNAHLFQIIRTENQLTGKKKFARSPFLPCHPSCIDGKVKKCNTIQSIDAYWNS